MEQEEEYKVIDVADLYWENVMMIKEIKKYKSALSEIAYLENEWDDPVDFAKDLKDIAKKALQ